MTNNNNIIPLATTILYITSQNPNGMPSGHIFAQVIDKVTIDDYQQALALLKSAKLIHDDHHLLTATDLGLEKAKKIKKYLE